MRPLWLRPPGDPRPMPGMRNNSAKKANNVKLTPTTDLARKLDIWGVRFILRPFVKPPKPREISRGAENPSRGECPAQLLYGKVFASKQRLRAVRISAVALTPGQFHKGRGESVMFTEGDFQRPARQLTPSAYEREFTPGSVRPKTPARLKRSPL